MNKNADIGIPHGQENSTSLSYKALGALVAIRKEIKALRLFEGGSPSSKKTIIQINGLDISIQLPIGKNYVLIEDGCVKVVTKEEYLGEQNNVGGFRSRDSMPVDFSGTNSGGWGGDGADDEIMGRVITIA